MTGAVNKSRPVVNALHVINGEFYAGAERVQDLLADRLCDFGYRVLFVCLKRGEFQRRLERGPRQSLLLPMGSRLDVFGVARNVAKYARATNCRLIHTHTTRSALVGAAASAWSKLPLVHHVHSPTARDSTRRWVNLINATTERLALRQASALLPVSQSLARDLRRQGHAEALITAVPNGVKVSNVCADPGLDPALSVGMVALFRPRKGVEVLLKALAQLHRQGSSVRLRAIGEFETPAYERAVRGLCAELGLGDKVEWLGFCRDVNRELSRVDVLALPSLFGEGMPMVVLEAMAAGLPVVATRVEGVEEVIRDGKEGILVQPEDVQGLAGAIGRMAADRSTLREMGAAGRKRQRDEYSDLIMAERLSAVYDRVLGCHAEGVA